MRRAARFPVGFQAVAAVVEHSPIRIREPAVIARAAPAGRDEAADHDILEWIADHARKAGRSRTSLN